MLDASAGPLNPHLDGCNQSQLSAGVSVTRKSEAREFEEHRADCAREVGGAGVHAPNII